MNNIDIALYIIAIILFIAAGLDVAMSYGNPARKVRFEWLAFAVLALTFVL